jgi:ABC-type dipeptide/oligopeptide/nickel transport system permease subunit
LYFDVPKQLPVLKSVSLLQSVASATQSVGIGLIIGVISGQVVAKKVITTMWLYFCSLQLTILIVLHSRTSAPASVEMIVG